MGTTTVTGAAIGSAIAYGTGGVLQHRAARDATAGRGLRLRLLAHLATQPMWLAGLAAGAVAIGLHALALSGGELAIVQPLLVSGLLFALPASVVLDGRRPSLAEWAWALLLVVAVAAFLLASHPSRGQAPNDTDRLAAITAIAAAVSIVVVGIGTRLVPTHKAALLGGIGGLAYGLTAALLKESIHLISGPHPVHLLTTWPLYLLLGVGAVALVVVQASYQAGPLAASLPPLTMLNPIIAIVVGVAAFDERLSDTPAALGIEATSLVAMTLAVMQLARRSSRLEHREPKREL